MSAVVPSVLIVFVNFLVVGVFLSVVKASWLLVTLSLAIVVLFRSIIFLSFLIHDLSLSVVLPFFSPAVPFHSIVAAGVPLVGHVPWTAFLHLTAGFDAQ